MVLLTPEQLQALVEGAVRRVLAEVRPASERPLTSDEAAELLGIEPKTLRAWAAEGRIQGSKQGRAWRFTRAQVEAARNPTASEVDDAFRGLG